MDKLRLAPYYAVLKEDAEDTRYLFFRYCGNQTLLT
jgi:hypothetical protein